MKNPKTLLCLLSVLLCARTLFADPTPSPASAPELHLEPYVFEAADGTRIDAELGTFEVPENRQTESRNIKLKFVRFKSTSPRPGSPIVYLAGGPGGSGTGAARYSRFPLFMAFREIADVIAFDQRGTGMSGREELQCEESYQNPIDQPGDPKAMLASARRGVAACARAMRDKGVDLAGYNSIESADDIDALRRALGAKKITLWGISYGTHLTLATLKRHGSQIDRVIMAGLEGPDQSYKLPSNGEKLMAEIAAIAAADPAVRKKLPDLRAAAAKVLTRLERQPVSTEVVDPRSGQRVGVTLGAFDVRVALSGMLRGPSSFAAMAEVIYEMQQGNFQQIAWSVGRHRIGPIGSAMSYAMDCASGSTATRLEQIAKEARQTLLQDAINFPYPGICEAWNVPDLGDDFRSPIRSDVPALFISGTLDGRTPPSNAEEIRTGFANGAHLVIEGAGHSDPLFLSSPKIAEIMLAFLRGEPVESQRITLPPVRLIPPRDIANVPPDILARYVGTYRIDDNTVREVTLMSGQLFTQRTGSRKLPITPISETEYFYSGSTTRLEFVSDDTGHVLHMVMNQDGEETVAVKMNTHRE